MLIAENIFKLPRAHDYVLFFFRRRDKGQFKKSKGKPWSRGTHSPFHTPSHEQSSAYAFIKLIGRKQCVDIGPEG